jgi:hypothetical protein
VQRRLTRAAVAPTLTGELVEFFGRGEPQVQDQKAATESAWKFSHSWTLAHVEVRQYTRPGVRKAKLLSRATWLARRLRF